MRKSRTSKVRIRSILLYVGKMRQKRPSIVKSYDDQFVAKEKIRKRRKGNVFNKA